MSTPEVVELRRTSRRLAVSFAALMVALVLVIGGVVFAVVIAGQNESIRQSLIDAEHLDSTRDAAPGIYIAIVEDGHTVISPDAPAGFPDERALSRTIGTGEPVDSTAIFAGREFAVRTDSDSGRVVQVAVDRHESQEELQRLAVAFAAAALVAVAASGFAAAWMSRRAMRPMAQALALQRRFVADASHELRTPLTLLSTRAQLLRRRVPDEDRALALGVDEVVQDSKALTEILDDLLISADPRTPAEQTDVDLTAIAADAVRSMKTEASDRDITIVRSGVEGPVIVKGARIALTRLVMAIVANALDHARREVVVDVATRGGNALIRVGDDGPGFPPELQSRVFERFASTRASGEATTGGSRHYGLGLALVAEVAASHHGTVAIGRSLSGGAEITVSLPLAQ